MQLDVLGPAPVHLVELPRPVNELIALPTDYAQLVNRAAAFV